MGANVVRAPGVRKPPKPHEVTPVRGRRFQVKVHPEPELGQNHCPRNKKRAGKHSAAPQVCITIQRAGDVNPRAFIITDIAPHHTPGAGNEEIAATGVRAKSLGQNKIKSG